MTLSPALLKYLARDDWYRSPILVPRMGIPFNYRHVSFSNCRETPAMRGGKLFVNEPCICLGVEAGVGVGKTTMTAAVVRYLIEEGLSERVAYYGFGDFVSRLLNPELRAETLDAAREADVLVIDDVGASFATRDGFAVALLEEIVIHREASSYSMLFTTNLPPEEFRKRFGERIFDRLRGEWGRWLNVDGPSLRRKSKAARLA